MGQEDTHLNLDTIPVKSRALRVLEAFLADRNVPREAKYVIELSCLELSSLFPSDNTSHD